MSENYFRKFNWDLLEKKDPRVIEVLLKFVDPRFLTSSGKIRDEKIFTTIAKRIEHDFFGDDWDDLNGVHKLAFGDRDTYNLMMIDDHRYDTLMDDPDYYKDLWENKVSYLCKYVERYNLQSLVLGISGGLDSSVCAAIAWEVEKRTGIRSIGISLPIVNSVGEISSADITGQAWYSPGNYITIPLREAYEATREVFVRAEEERPEMGAQTKIADGNIMARLRMITLYNFAGINKGMVLSTGNKTENLLGFFTIHGDEPMDYNLLDKLYKTEVYRFARWIRDNIAETDSQRQALQTAIDITPTDGLGISSSDLEQIGAESYYQVDRILERFVDKKRIDISDIPQEIQDKVMDRVKASEFKQRFI